MSAAQPNTKHAKSSEVRPKGIPVRIYNFFDSKVGLAILTFLLTGGLGTLATWLVTEVQQIQASRIAALHARATELSSLHTGVEANILQREIAADSFISAIEVGAGDAEVGQLWQKYEESANGEVLTALQSHLVITGHTQDGPDPGLFEGKAWLFWRYLSDVIQPRFASMHECLLEVHNAYVAAGEPLLNRLTKARLELSDCKNDRDWNKFAYRFSDAEKGPNNANAKEIEMTVSVGDWDDFKTCLEDYAYLLDLSARLEARAGQHEPFSVDGTRWGGCSSWDDVCRERNFFETLPTTLRKSCGLLDKTYE